jgi:hypothetical protein
LQRNQRCDELNKSALDRRHWHDASRDRDCIEPQWLRGGNLRSDSGGRRGGERATASATTAPTAGGVAIEHVSADDRRNGAAGSDAYVHDGLVERNNADDV